jgi:hypothetical protein
MAETSKQRLEVDKLIKQGWVVSLYDGDTVYLTYHSRQYRGTTWMCEVDEKGVVRGFKEYAR